MPPTEPGARSPAPAPEPGPRLLAARRAAAEERDLRLGLAAGGAAALVALLALRVAARFPLGVLLLDAGMAWGLFALLRLAVRDAAGSGPAGDASGAWILALGAFLPVPFLVQLLAALLGLALPAALRATWLLDVLVLAAVVALRWRVVPQGSARYLPLAGLALSGALLGLGVLAAGGLAPGAALVWAVTGVAVGGALVLQRGAARLARGTRWEVLGSGAALFLASSQLLDGVVSYLAVRDPLGVLGASFSEQVALSAWLLQHTGPGYALVKWLLALGVVHVVDGRAWPARAEPATRIATFVFVAFISLGPGLFSATRLLGA